MKVGTYAENGRLCEVLVELRRRLPFGITRWAVVVAHHAQPGNVTWGEVAGSAWSGEQAFERAQALVVSRGGIVGASPEALAGAAVSHAEARAMFSEGEGLKRYLHVPAPRADEA